MAESQLLCLEDGLIGSKVPESSPEFYYSEPQRAALEELLRNGDGAFKTRLKDDDMTDFLSAREIKVLLNTFSKYDSAGDVSRGRPGSAGSPGSEQGASELDRSTYWPQMSDTEVPPLDMGWSGGGLFKGVTRVAVHTHPPKENGPHVKEVVRRLIQEASKLIAIVMDLLTDPQILRDLMDAAGRRSVRVYILLENQGVPHFLDMCSRLKIDQQHLRNIRARSIQGVGLGLSFGKLPGSLCYKYMLVDGDKVMFGSYSFCWCTSRMDRNMITVMTGQVVDFFDRDFRELYAVSGKLDLYKEFHVSQPAANSTGSGLSKAAAAAAAAAPKRPLLRANTSRFQVSLGDPGKAGAVQVPAHKYYNPKYALAFGDVPRPPASLQVRGPKRGSVLAPTLEEEEGKSRVTTSERMDRLSPQPPDAPSETLNWSNGTPQEKKGWSAFVKKLSRMKSSRKLPVNSHTGGSPPLSTGTSRTDVDEENLDVFVRTPSKWKAKKLGQRTESEQSVNATQDNESVTSQHRGKPPCKVS